MGNAWLVGEVNDEAVEKLKGFGVTSAVRVGYSGSGNIKYLMPDREVKIIHKSAGTKHLLQWIRTMAQNGYGETREKSATIRQRAKTRILMYVQEHLDEAAAIWTNLCRMDGVVLRELGPHQDFVFSGGNLKHDVILPVVTNSIPESAHREDGDYSEYLRQRLTACLPCVSSAELLTDHIHKVKQAVREYHETCLDVVRGVFSKNFPDESVSFQYSKNFSAVKTEYDGNGVPDYGAVLQKLRQEAYQTICITVTLPGIGQAVMTIKTSGLYSAMAFADGNGRQWSLDEDLKLCTTQAADHLDAMDAEIPVSLPGPADAEADILPVLLEHAAGMQLVPEDSVKEKVRKTYETYADINSRTDYVARLDLRQKSGPDYQHAYNLLSHSVSIPTIYGTIDEKGRISGTPFACMLNAIQKKDSAIAKKKQATDEIWHELSQRTIRNVSSVAVKTNGERYPYMDGSPFTLQASVCGVTADVSTGPIIGRTTSAYTKRLREEAETAYDSLVKKTDRMCEDLAGKQPEWLKNPVVPAIIRYVKANERYVTENAVVQALRGTKIQLNARLTQTEDCGRLAYLSKEAVARVAKSLIDHRIIATREIKGEYGYFDLLKTTIPSEKICILYQWLEQKEEERAEDHVSGSITDNPFRFHNLIRRAEKKAETGEDIMQEQILLLQNLGDYYLTGYYLNDIADVIAMQFSDGIKMYLEMTVAAAKDDDALTEEHKKLIAKVQTTARRKAREKKRQEKGRTASAETG